MSLLAYTFQHYVLLFSYVPMIFPFLVGVLNYSRMNEQGKLIMSYSIISFFMAMCSAILWAFKENNLFMGHFHAIIQFAIIARIYQLEYRRVADTRWITWIIVIFSILAILNTIFLQPLDTFNSNVSTTSSILLILLIIPFFILMVSKPKLFYIERNPMFWFSSGALLFNFGTLFLFAISNSTINLEKELAIPVWMIYNIFMWVFFTLATIALWIKPLPSK